MAPVAWNALPLPTQSDHLSQYLNSYEGSTPTMPKQSSAVPVPTSAASLVLAGGQVLPAQDELLDLDQCSS